MSKNVFVIVFVIILSLLSSTASAQTKKVTRNRTCSVCQLSKPASAFSGESKKCKTCLNKARQKAEREKEACDERLRSCGEFHDGLASYKNTHHYLRNETGNDKFGYIDKMGKIVIPCQWYYFRDGSPYFQLGLALVKNSSGRCGYINTKGEVVIPFKWINAWNFYKGTGTATVVDDNGKWHEINTRGEIVK